VKLPDGSLYAWLLGAAFGFGLGLVTVGFAAWKLILKPYLKRYLCV
jgi:hypothetical protein